MQVLGSSDHERQTMKDALEMAVLTSVSHPNIIRVYACLTNMVEHGGKGRDYASKAYQIGASNLCIANTKRAVNS
jgi:hypothetical protein